MKLPELNVSSFVCYKNDSCIVLSKQSFFLTSGMKSTKRIKCGEDLALNDNEKN